MGAPRRSKTHVRHRKSGRNSPTMRNVVMALVSSSSALVSAQDSCISLKDSSACPAFQAASISTNATLVDYFSFLQYVSDKDSFDTQLMSYIKTNYVSEKYQSLFGCSDIDLTDSTDMYARFTATVLCNAVVQNSIGACGLSEEQSRPLCADTCAEFAQSEAYVTADNSLCANPSGDLAKLIRADFTNCALPAGSLSGTTCISGIDNEPENCGYGNSTVGLCQYCASGGINSTDTCCYNAKAEDRCKDVKLPSITATMTFTTPTSTASSTSSASNSAVAAGGNKDDNDNSGLGGGAIAGIVIGALAGVALLGLLIFFCLRMRRRRPSSPKGSIFNQPSPARKSPPVMTQTTAVAPQGYEVLPGGRIARMSALEGHSGDSPSHHRDNSSTVGAVSTGTGYMAGRRRGADQSSSDGFDESPESEPRTGILRPPPTTLRRNGSLSSGSVLGSSVPQSPTSAGDFSSPQGMTSQQSEQLPFFKDYYSQDDIHPGDRVATLWAYQPRAADEFSLERGDMLKVVGIWDDGWATGILLNEKADEWEARRQAQRDSGVSNTSGRRDSSPEASGEIKAFPLLNEDTYRQRASNLGVQFRNFTGFHSTKKNLDKSKRLETTIGRIFGLDLDLVNLRKEVYDSDCRTLKMQFGTAEEDSFRRDGTVNPLFFDLTTRKVVDFNGKGLEDLRAGIMRTLLPLRQTFSRRPFESTNWQQARV
ncbi:Fc.00g088780.m01.CDS01 [Cosmosporella sp. VM-42]